MHDDRLGYFSKSYLSQLETINNASFTAREIDILACVINMRGNTKIASILNIAPRTVETHILNIKRKIEHSSREGIIDFIERSGKLIIIRKHYQTLLIKAEFNKKLRVSSIAARNKFLVCHFCIPNKGIEESSLIVEAIQTYFKLLGIKTIVYKKAEEMLFQHKNDDHFIYVINDQESICLKYIEQANKSPLHYTFLLLNNIKESVIEELVKSGSVVNFKENGNYYLKVFDLLKRLFPTINFDNIIFEFKTYYQAVREPVSQPLFIGDSNPKPTIKKSEAIYEKIKRSLITTKIIFILIVLTTIAIYFLFISHANPNILKVNAEIDRFANTFSSSVTINNKTNIYEFESEAERIAKYIDNQQIQAYFITAKPSKLINLLYSMHIISTHYTYDKHNGKKAREILQHAKSLAEKYVQNKSNILLNFEELGREEVHIELSIIKDLPEIYTKIIYSLGRTYMYQGDIREAIKYFELSKYLGCRLNLFEGYLSITGAMEITNRQIEGEIKKGNYNKAIKEITELIKLADIVKNEAQEYKVDYSPGGQFTILVPKDNIYNIVCRGEEIVKHYLKLITITKDIEKKKIYAEKIQEQFIGNKLSPGLLSQLKEIAPKKAVNVYNILGYVLLKLYDDNISFRQFKDNIIKELVLYSGNDLEIIEQIFNFSKLKSRSNDFTKADAYDGLLKVHKRRLNQENTTLPQVLKTEIQVLQNKRDSINKELNRVPYYNLYFPE